MVHRSFPGKADFKLEKLDALHIGDD